MVGKYNISNNGVININFSIESAFLDISKRSSIILDLAPIPSNPYREIHILLSTGNQDVSLAIADFIYWEGGKVTSLSKNSKYLVTLKLMSIKNKKFVISIDSVTSSPSILPAGGEINDLTAAVTWDDVPDANITESSVTQHEAALSITESQISDLDHDDSDAIHDNVSGEISAITAKDTPTTSDFLLIEDAAASNAKKRITIGDLPSGGGGLSTYASFHLTTGGVTGVSTTATTLTINATELNTGTFTLAASVIQVDNAGDYEINAFCYFNTGGTSRSEYTMWLEKDAAGDNIFVEIAGTRTGTYQRGYDTGDTASFNKMMAVTANDQFRLRIVRTAGGATSGYQDNNGTGITFKRLDA
jgi:hypothetical protein